MGKWINDSLIDLILDRISQSTTMSICSDQPTTRDEAVNTYSLVNIPVSSSDFTITDGDTSGRKVTIAQKQNVSITNSGNATHIALCDAGNLLYVTTIQTPQTLVAGNTLTTQTWQIEISDPN